MGVLIDPYMFKMSDAQEIKNNISFFQKAVRLCRQADKEKRLSIMLYQGMIENISQRAITLFPIKIQAIKDTDLRNTILQINAEFLNVLLPSVESIDIDACSGDQEFEIDDSGGMADDSDYYEMFCTLLIPCYLSKVSIDDRILTGKKKEGKQIGETFRLTCRCSENEYIKNCLFAGIDDFIPAKDKIAKSLKELRQDGKIPVVETVEAVMGDHHNHVQADGKKFRTLNDLSFKNKVVLKLLQELGLYRIIFERFISEGVRATGTMSIHHVREENKIDIICVRFNAETDMQLLTSLYFPKGIGQLLQKYFQNEQLTYKNVSELIEKVK